MKTWPVDTGPFVAYVSRTDPMHGPVAATLDKFAGQLVTTHAVVTEVMYFLADVAGHCLPCLSICRPDVFTQASGRR